MKHNLLYKRDYVRPLREAENQFLQVLLTQFRVRPRGRGLDLHVAIDPESPTIWLSEAKRYLMQTLPSERRGELQTRIEKFFETDQESFEHDDQSFPFRFGNGGTLPVVRIKDKDYFCLFFRDAHPMGWNIANGGANNLSDLLHPDSIIERELREELIIAEPEPTHGRRYVFDWHDAHLRDHPDFALADRLWVDHFRRQNLNIKEEVPLPLKWIPSVDEEKLDGGISAYDAVWVSYKDQPPIHTGHGFVNINAEDFGIEFDRIAKLAVGPEAVFCDGEIRDGQLLNRVVGLFSTDRVQASLEDPRAEFMPDRLFWGGVERTGDDIKKVVELYLNRVEIQRISRRPASSVDRTIRFELCPVTRNIIRRYLRQIKDVEKHVDVDNAARYDVFLSFGSEDRQLARQVYDSLNQPGQRQVFFSDASTDQGPFARQIDLALDQSWAFVAVAGHVDRFYKSWVQYEWETFHNDILSAKA